MNDHYQGYIGVTEDIEKAIKATARTITKSRLSDKIRSEVLLQKAGLKCIKEAVASVTAVTVWKSKTLMDPLGQRIFREKSSLQCTRSITSKDMSWLSQVIPPYPPTSWQESGTQFLDSNRHLHWELPKHLLRNGRKKSPHEHHF
jgi:hypothetical protein